MTDAVISARIARRLADVDFGRELAAEGTTTVTLDAAGRLVEHRPDGTSMVLDVPPRARAQDP